MLESASFNPILNEVAGGVRVQVDEVHAENAHAILTMLRVEPIDDDDAQSYRRAGVEQAHDVRCPRCELSYCFFERPRIRFGSPAAGANLLVLLASIVMRIGKPRWWCAKCGYTWNDVDDCPKRMTALPAGEPRPVFRLHRAHGGLGLFFGFCAGALIAAASGRHPIEAAVLLAGSCFFGWLIGRSIRRDVCSEPGCRAQLSSDADKCGQCRGVVAGAVRSTAEHYAAAADYRRELAAALGDD